MDSVLKSLRSMRENTPCDCVITCGEEEFPCHQLVLSACSSYFYSLFDTGQHEETILRINLTSTVSGPAMAAILDYIYSGKFGSKQTELEVLQEVVSACHSLKVPDLFEISLPLLAERLSSTDIQQFIQLCLQYEADGFKPQIIAYIEEQICHLWSRNDFLSMTTFEMKKLLEYLSTIDDDMKKTELDKAIVAWINGDKEREKDLGELDIEKSASVESKTQESDTQKAVFQADTPKKENDQHDRSKDNQNILFFRSSNDETYVSRYDIDNDKWYGWKVFPMTVKKNTAIVVNGSHMYFVGGIAPPPDANPSSEILDFCMNTNTLISTNELCFPVESGSGTILDDELYIIGKRYEEEPQPIQRYNIVTKFATLVGYTNTNYVRGKLHTFKDHVYITDNHMENACSIERYDPITGQWTYVSTKRGSYSDYFMGTVFLGNQLFEMSQFVMEDVDVNIYDISEDKWHHQAMPYDDGLEGVVNLWAAVKDNKPILLAEDLDNVLYITDNSISKWETKVVLQTKFFENPSDEVDVSKLKGGKLEHTAVIAYHGLPHHVFTMASNKWHHPVMPSLNQMRKKGQLTDVILICEQKEISVHSFILISALAYFRSMFSTGFTEAKNRKVCMPNISSDVMEIILTWIYTGRIEEDIKNDFYMTVEVLEAADFLAFSELRDSCITALALLVNAENWIEALQCAELYDSRILMSVVITDLAKNFQQLSESNDFVLISEDHLKRIVQHPELSVATETIYLAEKLLKWYHYDVENRGDLLVELVSVCGLDQSLEIALKSASLPDAIRSLVLKSTSSEQFACGEAKKCAAVVWSADGLSFLLLFGKNDEVALYDIESMQLQEHKPVPFCIRNGATVVGYGKHIYFFGGEKDGDDSVGLKVIKYCPFSNMITSEDYLNEKVVKGAACVLWDKIYIVSGNKFQCYSPFSSTCESLANTNVVHFTPIVFALNMSVFAYSSDSSDRSSESYDYSCSMWEGPSLFLEQYSPFTNQWTIITRMPNHGPAYYVALFNEMICLVICNIRRKHYWLASGLPKKFEDYWYDMRSGEWSVKPHKIKSSPAAVVRFGDVADWLRLPVVDPYRPSVSGKESLVLYTAKIDSKFSFPIKLRSP